MADSPDYRNWTRESLVKRIKYLEGQISAKALEAAPKNDVPLPVAAEALPETAEASKPRQQKRQKKPQVFDPSKYATRLIALKIAYLGKNFNGFEHQVSASCPTIEEELWKALVKSCLIYPTNGPEKVDLNAPGLEYSKCGRTDKGVSAFGQVVGLRVRSNRPLPREPKPEAEVAEAVEVEQTGEEKEDVANGGGRKKKQKVQKVPKEKPEWDPIADEMNYPRILNRLLPPEIRVLAWCPNPPEGFDARFSCRERQYRYFFTQPAFPPLPDSVSERKAKAGAVKEGWLDIDAMREAAKLFEGSHDFRNFCKVEAGKQITNFVRRMFESDIVEVEDTGSILPYLNDADVRPENIPAVKHPKVYYFHVRGSAFLWHQIRHMVAVLFLVGQGLEKPSIISELLDVEKHPRRPNYHLADEVPLVLWDCIFPDPKYGLHNLESDMTDKMNWIWVGEDNPSNLHGTVGLANEMWKYWREKKIDELLANRLFDKISRQADLNRRTERAYTPKATDSQKVFLGANEGTNMGKYLPVLKKVLLPSPEELNDAFAQKYGFANSEALKETGSWRLAVKAEKVARKNAAAGQDVVMAEAGPGKADG
ncbi:pseudouridine synthase [Coniochaeta ligniaria NRRL 30616]|uniref:Pseudouridine synthase n=1 Tax=Coniochaeta ligniaria NRRL 30616 TaxID=1408157 RepID=A0A1J7IIX8_9PEZI|nr:pseudouridine synthase [Coniochaeta ligniaria NRRL 30616]